MWVSPPAARGLFLDRLKFTSDGSQSLSPEGSVLSLLLENSLISQPRAGVQFAFERRDMEFVKVSPTLLIPGKRAPAQQCGAQLKKLL